MNTQRAFATFLIVGFLALPAISKNAILNVSNVTIVSIEGNHLAVSRSVKGKLEQLYFVLNPDTVRTGNLAVGSQVTIHYTTKNHENIATSIQSRESATSSARGSQTRK